MKLEEDNTFKIEKIVGNTASVYIPIPANRSGSGKIQVSVNGCMHEINAMTDGNRLETCQIVDVLSVISPDVVLVKVI